MQTSLLLKAVHGYIEAFDKGDIELIRKLYADNATLEDPVGSAPRVGMVQGACRNGSLIVVRS